MERIPAELIYILIFVGIIVFNYVMQQAARRRQAEEQAQAPPPEAPPSAEDPPLEDIWGRSRAAAPAPAPAPVVKPAPLPVLAEPPTPRRTHPLRLLLGDKRSLRRAVVLMTVLGPCRAEEQLRQR